jgi:hypothetical protein
MSFAGLSMYRTLSDEEKQARKERGLTNWDIGGDLMPVDFDTAIAAAEKAWETKGYVQIQASWFAVYTPDPTNPNASWAQATPSGQINLTIQNPGALKGLKQMIEEAELHGRKNGDHPTKEFYVDFYPAPAAD